VTLRLSRLAQRVGHSGIIAADDRMERLRAAGRDILNLGAGQLDFDSPAPTAQAGADASARGRTRYTPVAGTVALRRAVRAKFERENGLRFGDDQAIVGAGAKSVIFHALLALVDPGAVFGDDRCLRISFATSLDEWTAARGRLAQARA
jgi:aspartate aminotransferase